MSIFLQNGYARRSLVMLGTTLFLLLGLAETSVESAGLQKTEKAESGSSNSELIARGKYLVEGVAGCGDCHTPRKPDGTLDRSKWLEGAPVFLQPARPVPGWPIVAPRLARVLPGEEADIVNLLTTGVWRDGKHLRPPMPRFHMNHGDAEAIVAYLKSL